MCVIQIIYVCCDRLLDVAGRACYEETHKGLLFNMSSRLLGSMSAVKQNSAGSASTQSFAAASSRYFAAESSKPERLNACVATQSRLQVIDLRSSVSHESFLPLPVHGRLSPLPPLTPRSGHLSPATLRQSWAPGSRSDDHISLSRRLRTSGHPGASPAERVAISMACTDYPPEALAKVEAYKQKLNSSSVEWKTLCIEDDPHVLSALMWDWIDELKVSTTATVAVWLSLLTSL